MSRSPGSSRANMDIKQTTARLRRTFHYPTDDSSSNGGGTPEVLDEEEQENLIQTLAEQNAFTNQQYQILLLALPILSSIPYILALFRSSTLLIALLGLTSLTSTVYLLFSLPITETGIPILDAWVRSGPTASRDDEDDGSAIASGSGAGAGPSGLGTLNQRRRRRRTNSLSYAVPKSPLEKHLPYLNIGLCVILILSGVLAHQVGDEEDGKSHHSHQFGWLGLGNLPAIVYGVVIIAKMVMASVDPERELQKLRYEYKGA